MDAFEQIKPQVEAMWKRYRDAATPWPSDPEARKQLIAMRKQCDEADLTALRALPDSRSKQRAIETVLRRLSTY